MSLTEFESELLIGIKLTLEQIFTQLCAMNAPAADKAPRWPRLCRTPNNSEAWCHGFFNGDKHVDSEHTNVPAPVAVVELEGGYIQVMPATWVTLK